MRYLWLLVFLSGCGHFNGAAALGGFGSAMSAPSQQSKPRTHERMQCHQRYSDPSRYDCEDEE